MKTKKERRMETARMTKCSCGAVAGLGQTQCGRCRERDQAVQAPISVEDERERFEQAVYNHYLERHAAGKTEDRDDPAGTREQLLWRDDKGNYGVLMFNASWWAWQAALGIES